ncbi:transglutaminase-like domain-containing protein [Oscillatoria sp. CS-180]|uniref:SirB1 family protein n=1 Tax=Oscillatoria sp. CS-180 TaxID=3021720 RepID=UPI00232ADE52|nr:transglutaminase-like domain-containing protein [Oscillatoria sp. CS-180]MDB9529164.1 transglutaminase-like domain-containing protein [Oscillatoria sp. CS-180]
MSQPLARDRFIEAVQKPDEAINLATAALYIAQEEYPELDCGAYLHRLDDMATALRERLPQEAYPLKIIRAINEYLFESQGFVGNNQAYYDPRNSFLNQVLDRRTGIPITLSLVYLELAQRIDFPMAGVGMPGHFLVRPTVEEMAIFVDAFHKGEILFEDDCRNRIRQMYGKSARMLPQHLEPISSKRFLARMLTNLKVIYLQQQDIGRALAAIDRILLLIPDSLVERRDRGLINYREGNLTEARDDLKAYLINHPDAQDSFEIQQVISQINAALQ